MSRSAERQYDGLLASLAKMKPTLRLFFTQNQEDTALILSNLANAERQASADIYVPTVLPEKKNQASQLFRVDH